MREEEEVIKNLPALSLTLLCRREIRGEIHELFVGGIEGHHRYVG